MSLAFTETGEFVKGVRGKEQVAEEEAELPSTKFKEYGGVRLQPTSGCHAA